MTKAFYITAAELAQRGKDNIPDELLSAKHLIYSSPATLAFNSPGAQRWRGYPPFPEKLGDERANRREGEISGKLGEVHGYQFGSNLEERPDRFDLRLR